MKSRALMFWLAVLLVFGGAMTMLYAAGMIGGDRREDRAQTQLGGDGDGLAYPTSAKPEEPTLEIGQFEMTDQLGREFHSDQLNGQIWVGSIFFSRCPSTCRMQNAEVAKLQAEFGDQGVHFVSITCDPKNDDVATLSNYARLFNADPNKWYFLTGPYETAEKVGNTMFGITVQPETHSDRLVLIDRTGKVHSTHRSMLFDDTQKLRSEIKQLLSENPPTEEQPPSDTYSAETESPAVSSPDH